MACSHFVARSGSLRPHRLEVRDLFPWVAANGFRERVAPLTPDEMDQEPWSALPPKCRKTFGAFALDMVQILPSRGLTLARRVVHDLRQ